MLKATLGAVGLAFIAVMTASSPQQGCRDVQKAWTHLAYYPHRDMRKTVMIAPQRDYIIPPDSLSVPVTGRDWPVERAVLEATFSVPPPNDSSLARGERKFRRTCVPCHGPTLAGEGPVAAKFMPPPDLLKETTRGRSDGYIYGYIRHGGAIMPSYGAQVSREEAYDLIHYLRHMQRTSPR
jgi:mono/diheme cytochrome c family protein